MEKITIEQAKAELETLKKTTLKADGSPRADAKAENLARIEQLQGAIAKGEMEGQQPLSPAESEAKIAELEAENRAQADQIRELSMPKGIATAEQLRQVKDGNFGKKPTVEQGFRSGLHAALTVRDPEKLTAKNRIDLEREIRRFVKLGGRRKTGENKYSNVPYGFKKGVSAEDMNYAAMLLERIGRGKAKDIIKLTGKAFTGDEEGIKQKSAAYYKVGVHLDLDIIVPGMEALGNKAG